MIHDLASQARVHADNLHADIRSASSRQEHMRLTRLAIEADRLATQLGELSSKVAALACDRGERTDSIHLEDLA